MPWKGHHTGHLVAFAEEIGFKARSGGGIRSIPFSGEGLVANFERAGRVLLQPRSIGQLLAWLIPQLPEERKGSD